MNLFLWLLVCAVGSQTTTIQNAQNLVTVSVDGNLKEDYSVWDSSQRSFVLALSYKGPTVAFSSSTIFHQIKWLSVTRVANDTLRIVGSGSCTGVYCSTNITRTIVLSVDGFHVTMIGVNNGTPLSLTSAEDWYSFQVGSPSTVESVFSQSLKHEPHAVVPHWQFKSPTIVLQQGTIFAALVMDVNDEFCQADRIRHLPPFMDLRNNGSTPAQFAAALGNTKLTMHSIYSRDPSASMSWTGDLRIAYYLLITANVTNRTDLSSGVITSSGVVTRFLWKTFGHPRLLASPDMQTNFLDKSLTTFDTWRAKTWYSSTGIYYFEFPCNGSTCASLRCNRNEWADHVGNDNDAWFNSWFQTLRTAYGWYSYGKRVGDDTILEKASNIVNLALAAPNPSGAFPSIFWLGGTPSEKASVGASECRPTPLPPKTDLKGADYYHFAVTQGDPASVCQAACCNDTQCFAWTVVSPWTSPTTNCPANSTCCWLKSGVPRASACNECTSGTMDHDVPSCKTTRLPTQRDIPGGDYKNFPITDPNPESICEAACCQDQKCAAWVLASPQQSDIGPCLKGSACCWLKSLVPPQVPCAVCTAGTITRPVVLNWLDDSGWAGLCNLLPNSLVPPNCMGYFHAFDMSWTGWWLFKWFNNLLPKDPRILGYLAPLGDFLVQHQNQQTGVIPSWYRVDEPNNPPSPYFKDFNAETAGSALFLLELYDQTKAGRYMASAKSALAYLEQEIIIQRKWWDFETFMSCSPKPLDFYDSFTRQYPQNTLSKFQAAFAFLRMYQISGDLHYLNVGVQIVDYTALIQQVWSHVLLTPHLLGGFTSQNTDAEWSDARQAHAAEMYFGYYNATKNLDYLERGVAAVRSCFAVSPFENWAHTGGSEGDLPGALSSFHWGEGSGLATVEMYYDWLKDAYINLMGGIRHGVGVNGCTITNLTVDAGKSISFTLSTTYTWTVPLITRVEIEPSSMLWTLIVNGKSLGPFTTTQLSQGVPISPNVFSS